MPGNLKDLVHERMEKTGESYQQALRHVRAQEDRPIARDERAERARTVADTAFSIAVVRAEEGQRPQGERLFDDPYAHLFAAAGAHAAESTQRFLDLPFFRDGVRLRTRYIDDAVRAGLAAGLDQLVLLGAGFDVRGMRMREVEERPARVYEVDTAEQLQRKREVLEAAGKHVPAHVRYVPFGFGGASFEAALASALEAQGFRRREGALFVWEGVIGYITSEEIDRTLRFMASEGGPRARVVLTYGQPNFEPDGAVAHVRRAGFSTCEELTGDDLWRRYLPGDPHPNAIYTRVGTAIV